MKPGARKEFEMGWKLVEKKDRHAVHGLFDSLARAERHLRVNIPEYCRRGYFTDKSLKPEDFEIISDGRG